MPRRPSLTDTLHLYSRCIDEPDALSLNGCLVAAEVLRLVPSAAAFRTALRAVKLWARRRHIEGFALGLAVLEAEAVFLYRNQRSRGHVFGCISPYSAVFAPPRIRAGL